MSHLGWWTNVKPYHNVKYDEIIERKCGEFVVTLNSLKQKVLLP